MSNTNLSAVGMQPLSVAALHDRERAQIVVSWTTSETGKTIVVSFYEHDIWELWPLFDQASRSNSEKRINWLRAPKAFVPALKAVLYRYLKVGRPGFNPPEAGTVRDAFVRINVFLRYLHERRLTSLSQVNKSIVADFVHKQSKSGKLNSRSLKTQLLCIELLYIFKDEHPDGLKGELWAAGLSCQEVAGFGGDRKENRQLKGRTPLIPQATIAALFTYGERILESADSLLDERDRGLGDASELFHIRDACFFLIGLLTGMRCDEILGVRVGAGRTEFKTGYQYNWIKSIEHKTKQGNVEYLVSSMGLRVVHIMERWSEPYRQDVEERIRALGLHTQDNEDPKLAKALAELLKQRDCLFFGQQNQVVSGRSWGSIMKSFALRAGVDWNLAPHQLRRAYAWTFVRHRLGNLLLLREQFKHASLEMSQLYAANPLQDETLYDECLAELYEYRVEIVQSWTNQNEPLSGGAGRQMMSMRANAFPNREAMLRETANKVSIRSTGHSWCLSQFADSCGGQGLYESSRCEGCGSSVIDKTFKVVWLGIHEHQLELRSEAARLGEATVQRVERDLARSRKVLTDLGVFGPGGGT